MSKPTITVEFTKEEAIEAFGGTNNRAENLHEAVVLNGINGISRKECFNEHQEDKINRQRDAAAAAKKIGAALKKAGF
jgi:hypothetical protein